MNIRDDISDDDVLRAAAISLSALPVARPPAAGLSLAGPAGVLGLGLGLTGALGGHSPARTGTAIRTAAFTLAKNANGTATLTLTRAQVLNPGALQQALRQDGIPAW